MTESNQNVTVGGPTVVNMFAGPGSGKSTTAAALFTLLKLHEGIRCELVPEFAKDLVWEERYHTLKNQFYLFSKQQHRIWRVSQKVDVTITDSPILLSNIYRQHMSTEKFRAYVLEEFERYNNINFFIERTKRYAKYGRNETEHEAQKIDEMIKKYLSDHDIHYYSVEGNVRGIDTALSTILDYLGKDKQYKIAEI